MDDIYTIVKKRKRIRMVTIILELLIAITCFFIAIMGLIFHGNALASILLITIGFIFVSFIIWFTVLNKLPDEEILKEVNDEFVYNSIRFKFGLPELYLTPHFLVLSQGGMLSIIKQRDIISMSVKKEGSCGVGRGFCYITHVMYIVTKTRKYSTNVGKNRDKAEQFIGTVNRVKGLFWEVKKDEHNNAWHRECTGNGML